MALVETLIPQFNTKIIAQLTQPFRSFLTRKQPPEQMERVAQPGSSVAASSNDQGEANDRVRGERMERLRALKLNQTVLADFLAHYQAYDRERLLAEGYLLPRVPAKGGTLIAAEHRTDVGNALLQHAKDVLFGLLFGDKNTETHFERVERELLTFALPRFKAEALSFMQACTELNAVGVWQDPEGRSNDERADNVLLQIEYGEVKGESIGDGIIRCLSLINNLEVNEQILYARMINIEQSTLIV